MTLDLIWKDREKAAEDILFIALRWNASTGRWKREYSRKLKKRCEDFYAANTAYLQEDGRLNAERAEERLAVARLVGEGGPALELEAA